MSSLSTRTPSQFFGWQKTKLTIFFVGIMLVSWLTASFTQFDLVDAFQAIPEVIVWTFTRFVPNARAFERLPRIMDRLLDTIFMSIMASTVAAVVAFPFALFGSRTTRITGFLAVFSRGIASINRNIPVAAWAMIFLLAFGQSSFTGFLALFFATFGFLTRAFMETIDEASASSVEALRAVGASYPQMIAQAVIPGTLPQVISWVLYMIETNIRSATLVGLLTGSGIGFLFDFYYKSRQYGIASLVVIMIVIVVLAIEWVSNSLRRVIL